MVSERRRARMQAVGEQSGGVPDWVWDFRINRWASARRAAGLPVDLAVFVEERAQWHRRRAAWLRARGMTVEELERLRPGR